MWDIQKSHVIVYFSHLKLRLKCCCKIFLIGVTKGRKDLMRDLIPKPLELKMIKSLNDLCKLII